MTKPKLIDNLFAKLKKSIELIDNLFAQLKKIIKFILKPLLLLLWGTTVALGIGVFFMFREQQVGIEGIRPLMQAVIIASTAFMALGNNISGVGMIMGSIPISDFKRILGANFISIICGILTIVSSLAWFSYPDIKPLTFSLSFFLMQLLTFVFMFFKYYKDQMIE